MAVERRAVMQWAVFIMNVLQQVERISSCQPGRGVFLSTPFTFPVQQDSRNQPTQPHLTPPSNSKYLDVYVME